VNNSASSDDDRAGGLRPEPVAQSQPEALIPSACRNCAGDGWVCENHLDAPWLGGDGCCGGAGSPCPVCQPEMANAPLIYSIAQEARRYASYYPPHSDGRNTFEMFADFVETRSIAQAIEARRECAMTHTAERHRIKIADLDDNFIYMNMRTPRDAVDAFIDLINQKTSCAAKYERPLADLRRNDQ